MVEQVRSWLKDNATLVGFLVAQSVAILGGAAYGLSYMVTLENRVSTLEIRGSPHLAEINTRLTSTEKETHANQERLNKVIDVLTRELGKSPPFK